MKAVLTAACAALVLLGTSAHGDAQEPLGAPTISSVTAGTNDLTVVWTAPSEDGGATITSYDLRFIETSADDTVDGNWTEENIPSSGTLSYTVAGLRDGTGYRAQVRADNGTEGPWSEKSTGTTTDHGGTATNATTVTLDSSTPGSINPASDSDVFQFTLTAQTDVWVYATGELDSEGVLTRGRSSLRSNDDALLPPNPLAFSIRVVLAAGTYTVAVGSSDQFSAGTYTLHLRTLTEPGDTLATATAISLGSFHHGPADGTDAYYSFTLGETTDVWAAVTGFGAELDLLASDGTRLATTSGRLPYSFPPDRHHLVPVQGHFLRRELPAGTYYFKLVPLVSQPTTLFFYTATDPGNSTAGAVQLSPFIPTAGHISANGDQDYFSITLDHTTYLYVELVSAGERLPFEIAVLQDGSPVSFFTTPAALFLRTQTAVITRVWGEFSTGTYHIKITAPEGTTGRYMVYPYVDRAYTDLVRTCTALTTARSDPFFGCQWHLDNLEHVPGGAGHDINIEEAWAITQGEGAKVAFLDDGLHYSHEDLVDNVITANNHDFSGANDPTMVFGPLEFHGTSVAGILAARDNTIGGRGVAPRASIYGYNVTSYLTDDSVATALNLHLDETTVANNSWGMQHATEGPFPAPAVWIAALRTGVEQGSNGKGISYVWGVGNGHSFVDANYDELTNYFAVTTVCGVNYKDTRAAISELGANLWVCAPTQGIHPLADGTIQPGILTTANGDRYVANFSGTSASAPIVSGVIALVRAANPNLTWRDAKLILANTARKNDTGNTGWQEGALKYGSITDRYSFNHEYGFGVVDAGAAVTLAGTWTNLPAMLEYEVTSDDAAISIPDLESGSPPAAIESTVMLDPYVEFVEFVELNVDWDHGSMRDLEIELESPSGAVSTIAPHNASPRGIPWRTRFRFGSSRHLGEDAAGTWTLRITDMLEEHGGSVRSWSLKVYGHRSTPTAPVIESVAAGSESLTVAWTAPANTGASDIAAYDVRYIRRPAPTRQVRR